MYLITSKSSFEKLYFVTLSGSQNIYSSKVQSKCTLLHDSTCDSIQHIDGLGHKPFKSGQAFFQNDDKNDKTHRAQNVYLSRPT